MRTSGIAVILLALACGAQAADLACDAGVVRQSCDLLRLANWGQSDFERAAFIVRNDKGAHEFVLWPFERTSLHARFTGQKPDQVEAIIHTHPNSIPLPSAGDIDLAQRLRLPVYVVTRGGITGTDGQTTFFVQVGNWISLESRHQTLNRCDTSSTR